EPDARRAGAAIVASARVATTGTSGALRSATGAPGAWPSRWQHDEAGPSIAGTASRPGPRSRQQGASTAQQYDSPGAEAARMATSARKCAAALQQPRARGTDSVVMTSSIVQSGPLAHTRLLADGFSRFCRIMPGP